jgi:hypothetical protein
MAHKNVPENVSMSFLNIEWCLIIEGFDGFTRPASALDASADYWLGLTARCSSHPISRRHPANFDQKYAQKMIRS